MHNSETIIHQWCCAEEDTDSHAHTCDFWSNRFLPVPESYILHLMRGFHRQALLCSPTTDFNPENLTQNVMDKHPP